MSDSFFFFEIFISFKDTKRGRGRRQDIKQNATQHNDIQHNNKNATSQHNHPMPSVVMLSLTYAKCYVFTRWHDAECQSAEWHYGECHYGECHGALERSFIKIPFSLPISKVAQGQLEVDGRKDLWYQNY